MPPSVAGVTAALLATHYFSLGVLILGGMAWLSCGLGLDLPRPGTWVSITLVGSALWQATAVAVGAR